MTEEIDTAAQQLEESQSVYTQLQMKANANLSLATVENYAKENLGEKNRPKSIGFVELSKGDKGEVVQDNSGNNFFTNLWNSIKNFLS